MSQEKPAKDMLEIVERVMRAGRVDRVTVSRTHKTPKGDMFLSKSMNFSAGSEQGNPEGGLTLEESDVATMVLSKDVEIDLVYRALASQVITKQQADVLTGIAETRFSAVTQYMAKKVLTQGETP